MLQWHWLKMQLNLQECCFYVYGCHVGFVTCALVFLRGWPVQVTRAVALRACVSFIILLSHTHSLAALRCTHHSSEQNFTIHRNREHCGSQLSAYHDAAACWLDRMQILSTIPQCVCVFVCATTIDSANAYLTLAGGGGIGLRCIAVLSDCLLLAPMFAICGCDTWECDVNKMPRQMSDDWLTRVPSGCYYANLPKRYSPEIAYCINDGKFNVSNPLVQCEGDCSWWKVFCSPLITDICMYVVNSVIKFDWHHLTDTQLRHQHTDSLAI